MTRNTNTTTALVNLSRLGGALLLATGALLVTGTAAQADPEDCVQIAVTEGKADEALAEAACGTGNSQVCEQIFSWAHPGEPWVTKACELIGEDD